MKYLGIDYGTKRIGIAVSDEEGAFAFPKEILESTPAAAGAIAQLVQDEAISTIVVGYSLASNGQENAIASAVETFIAKLKGATSIPIVLEREDFSTVEAHRYQTSAGPRDDSAAAIILQRFLDKQKK